jgi:hypothetical protein
MTPGIPQSSSLSRQVLNPNPPPTTDPSRLVVFSCSRTWLAQGSTSFEFVSKPPLSPPTAGWEKKWFLKPTHETQTTRCLKCGKRLDCDIIYQVVYLCTLLLLLLVRLPPSAMLSHVWWEVGQHLLLVGGVRDVSSLTCTTWTCTVSYLHEYKLQTDCILSLNAKHCNSKKLCTWQWLLLEFLSLPKVATIFHKFVPM